VERLREGMLLLMRDPLSPRRRDFLRRATALIGGTAFLGAGGLGCSKKPGGGAPQEGAAAGGAPAGITPAVVGSLAYDLVVVRKAPAAELVRLAFERLGGIEKLVQPGQQVCLKPNMAWAREKGSGACTNPDVLAAVIDLILGAGLSAKDVVVFEHTRDAFTTAASFSEIQAVCDARQVALVNGDSQQVYDAQDPPEGTKYLAPYGEKEEVASDLMEADVVFNMPVLKQHSATGLSMGMKNLMGAIYNPRRYHGGKDADPDSGGQELDERIVDLTMLLKPKLTLTVLDATFVLREAGPKGDIGTPGEELQTLIVGTDPVAVDSVGAQVLGWAPDKVGHLKAAADRKIGEIDVDKLRASDRVIEIDAAADGAAKGEASGSGTAPTGSPDKAG